MPILANYTIAAAEDSVAHELNGRVLVRSFFAALDHWTIVIKELAGRTVGSSPNLAPVCGQGPG